MGDALVAPSIQFGPEGNFQPKSGHMPISRDGERDRGDLPGDPDRCRHQQEGPRLREYGVYVIRTSVPASESEPRRSCAARRTSPRWSARSAPSRPRIWWLRKEPRARRRQHRAPWSCRPYEDLAGARLASNSPSRLALRKLLTPWGVGKGENTQALTRPPNRGRGSASRWEGEGRRVNPTTGRGRRRNSAVESSGSRQRRHSAARGCAGSS